MPAKPKYHLPQITLDQTKIGERIAKIRKEKKLSQQQLAETIGIKRVLVSDYERGKIRLYDEMVARFAIALKVSAGYLLGIEDLKNIHSKKKITRSSASLSIISSASGKSRR
jgi:transcriptional regulator with XRE-family HTH domain